MAVIDARQLKTRGLDTQTLTPPPSLSAQNLSLDPRLHDINFSVNAGQILGIIGPNGAGKSTLLHCLTGLLPHTGRSHLDDTDLTALSPRERARCMGLLPQQTNSVWPLSVHDVVSLGRLPWGDNDTTAIANAMRATGIETLATARIDRLSGGERARVWLARVLAGQPRILIADEPTASLDLYYQQVVMDCLRTYANAGHIVIIAIHDLALAAHYCDQLLLLQNGVSQASGTPADVLTESLLSQVFGVPVHVDLTAQPPVVSARFHRPVA
ncbi:MAG: ABC transporter ATP-binding protein [Pusillimonas sp.]